LLVSEKRLEFAPSSGRSDAGSLKLPEESGILRALDGQHRLLALHQLAADHSLKDFQVPAVVFDNLTADQVVELFVTINSKHTKLNPSHLISLAGRRLYRDDNLAAAHDVVRALNDREDSPLYGEIKLLGVGTGRVAQAPLAQELKKLFAAEAFGQGRKGEAFREESKKFFVNYLKQVAQVFGAAWNGRKYSIKSAAALRAFVRVAPDVVRRLDQEHADRTDFRAIGRVISPWGRRIGDLRFETEGAWKRAGTTVDSLSKELRLALQYPEGAAV
jgi:DGQHR domain-containing protein